jgi:hypothetical protein
MPADEARVGAGADDDALGGADVADHAVGTGGGQGACNRVGEHADGRGDEHHVRRGDRAGYVCGLRVDGTELEGLRAHTLVGVIAAHVRAGASAGGQADRAADQAHAEHGHPQGLCPPARRIRRR